MATNVFIENYIQNLFERELGSSLGNIAPLTPFVTRPDAFDFNTQRRKSFPMPSQFYRPLPPATEVPDVIGPIQDGGDDPPPVLDIEEIFGTIEDYRLDDDTVKTDLNLNDKISNYFDSKLGMGSYRELASGQNKAKLGGVLAEVVGLVPLGGILSSWGEKANIQNLEEIAAKTVLGKPGYGIGRVNNMTVGVGPRGLYGTLPTGLRAYQTKEIKNALEGKGGALQQAYDSYTYGKGSFETGKVYSAGEIGYRETVLGSSLSDDLKAGLLGFDPNPNYAFSPGRLQSQFGRTTPQNYMQGISFKNYIENKKEAEGNRSGDYSSVNMGLETDFVAQDSQINPMGINLGLDTTSGSSFMTDISNISSGVDAIDNALGGGFGGPTGGSSGLDASSGFDSYSYDGGGYSDNEAGDNQGSGYGDGGWTAYGGRIGKAYGGGENKGFTSKTPKKITIQGVGLIKPDETFLKTDTVRDRYDLEARENDFIINGPTSEQFRKPILAFINQAETNLKNKGVDISVGKPTIPVSKQVPLLVASSETYIPKEYIEAFNPNNPEEGYKILEAMNNVGKPEVTRLKSQLDNPTDQNKYQANEGMRVGDPRQGFLSGTPKLNLTGPNIDKSQDAFVPGISDEPIAMNLDQQRYFGDYEFGDIKKAIKRTEIKGFEEYPYIFTGVKAKKGKASSAFGPMQITAKTLQDFKDRSSEYDTLDKNEKKYIEALLAQGEDKINKELYGTLKRGPKESRQNVSPKKIYGKKELGLKPFGRGVVDFKLHKKHYDKIADRVLMHKLGDHKTIEEALASYGEGTNYSNKVLNDLRDIMEGVEPPTPVESQ